MGKIKWKISVVALLAVLVTLMSQPALAYFTTVGQATSVITAGELRFLVHTTTDAGTQIPDEGVYILPGDVVSKRVAIESDCNHPFYLRIKIVCGVDAQELAADECLKLNIDENVWRYVDGWYYYQGIVTPGETTVPVFSHVEVVGSKVDNRYIGKTLTLNVLAQAVQSENNPITDGDPATAHGWPAEQEASE